MLSLCALANPASPIPYLPVPASSPTVYGSQTGPNKSRKSSAPRVARLALIEVAKLQPSIEYLRPDLLAPPSHPTLAAAFFPAVILLGRARLIRTSSPPLSTSIDTDTAFLLIDVLLIKRKLYLYAFVRHLSSYTPTAPHPTVYPD